MPSNLALLATVVPVVVALVGLIGTRILASAQSKARENEERLKGFEAYDHTYQNLRHDYDRVVLENNTLREDNRTLRSQRDAAQRKVEDWLRDRENP